MNFERYHHRQMLLGSLQGVRFSFPEDLETGFERGFLAGFKFLRQNPCAIEESEFKRLFTDFKNRIPENFEKWEKKHQIQWISEEAFKAGESHAGKSFVKLAA